MNIVAKWDMLGTHAWLDAPLKYKMLRARHSHIFHFEVSIPVTQSRQLEFLDVRETLIGSLVASYRGDFRGMSCEEIADSLGCTIHNLYEVWPTKVVVMEDQFVGSEVTYE